jgi:hypothetical protein
MISIYKLEEEKCIVAENMQQFGGGFVKALGVALSRADMINARKIKDTWPEYWAEYLTWVNQ